MTLPLLEVPENSLALLDGSVLPPRPPRPTAHEIRDAQLFDGDYAQARLLQQHNQQEYVQDNKTPTIGFNHQKLLGSISAGNTEETQRRIDYINVMREKGFSDIAAVYDKYSSLTFDDRAAFENGWQAVVGDRVQHYLDKSGAGESVWNFIKSLAPLDVVFDQAEAVDASWWGAVKGLRAELFDILSLPVWQRVERLEEFEKKVVATHDGNDGDVAKTMSLLVMSPETAAEELRFQQALSMFTIGDLAALGLGTFPRIGMAALKKNRVAAQAAKDSGNLKEMGKVLMADDLADPVDKTASLSVLKTEEIFPGSVDGVYATMKQNLDNYFGDLEMTFAGLRSWVMRGENLELMQRAGGAIPVELNTAWNQALRQIDEMSTRYLDETGEMLEVEIRSITKEGMEVEYRAMGMTGKQNIKFKYNDAGVLEVDEMTRLDALKSPAHVMGEGLYNEALAITGEQSRLANVLAREESKIWKPIRGNPFARSRVNAVLRQGDIAGEQYTIDQLRAGIEVTTKSGATKKVKLSPQEMEVYYGYRRFMDEMKWLNNYSVYEVKASQGMLTVPIKGTDSVVIGFFDELGDGAINKYASKQGAEDALAALYNKPASQLDDAQRGMIIGSDEKGWSIKLPGRPITRDTQAKPYLTKEDAQASVARRGELGRAGRNDEVLVFDNRINDVVPLTEGLLDDLYTGGYVLARTGDTHMIKGKPVHLIASAKTEIKPLNPIQLDFHTGYVPRIATNTQYGVWKKGAGGFSRLNRMFATREEAMKYANSRAGDKDFKFSVRHLKDLTGKELEEMVTETMGGAFVGKRTRPVKFGIDGTHPEYAKPEHAITQNIDFIANAMPINVWRQEIKKRWFNTVDAIARKQNMRREDILVDPLDFNSEFKLGASNRNRVALEQQREYIKGLMRVPSNQERLFQASMRHTAEFFEKFIVGDLKFPGVTQVAKAGRAFALNFSAKDPFSLLRTATFHPMLGAFNISQLVVQAFGASIVMAMNPLQAPRRFKEMIAMSTVRWMDHTSPGFNAAVANVAAKAGIDPTEFAFMVKAYRKSGLVDTVLMNADYAAAVEGYGLTRTAFRKLLDSGTVFYQAGERFNLEYTFLQAFANWRRLNPKAALNDKAIKEVLAETKRIGMDMGPANKAFYQKGWMSVPTQFTQVFWKFWGNMLGKRWTPKEKMMVGLSQPLLFGAAGVGAFSPDWMVNGIEQLAGGQGNLSPLGKRTIREGMFGILAESLGLEGEMAYRLAISGQDNIITGFLKSGGIRVQDMGPWVAMVGRYAKSIGHTVDVLTNPRAWVTSPELMKEVAWEWAKEAARVTSQYNNYEKGMALYEFGRYFSKNGVAVVDNPDWIGDEVTAFQQMMGMPPRQVAETFRRRQQTRTIDQMDNEAVAMLRKTMLKYMARNAGLQYGSEEYMKNEAKRRAESAWHLIRLGYGDIEQQDRIFEKFARGLSRETTIEEQEIMDYIRLFSSAGPVPVGRQVLEPIGIED